MNLAILGTLLIIGAEVENLVILLSKSTDGARFNLLMFPGLACVLTGLIYEATNLLLKAA